MAANLFWKRYSLITTLIFIYVVLFEFLLPSNNVFPKPTELYGALISLVSDYDLVLSLLFSVSVVVVSISLAILLNQLFAGFMVKMFMNIEQLHSFYSGSKYIPLFFFPLLIIFWFGNEFWAEYIFGLVIASYFLKTEIGENLKRIKYEFVDSAISLNIPKQKIYSEVIWKSILPKLKSKSTKSILLLWLLITLYEYIAGSYGIGEIYRSIVEYSDFSSLFSLSIIFGILLFLLDKAKDFILDKLVFWE